MCEEPSEPKPRRTSASAFDNGISDAKSASVWPTAKKNWSGVSFWSDAQHPFEKPVPDDSF